MTECRAEHIAVGSEILLGQILNTHALTVSREFSKYGFFLFYHCAVGDNMERIQQSFRLAKSRSNVVIVTGGLGPTDDDLTRESLAAFLHRELELSDGALAQLMTWFSSKNRKMPEANRKQAMLIQGADSLPNPNGTAPGMYVEADGVHYFLLPGPPLEMQPMLVNHVVPRLLQLFGENRALVSRVVRFCGIGESNLDEQIRDLTSSANPTVAPLASEGEVTLRITASAESEEAARQLIAPVEADLQRRFAEFIYGYDDEDLPRRVGRMLQEAAATLSVAESCTGGLISSMITAVPGASRYMLGSVTAYHNEVKKRVLQVKNETLRDFGAVSEQTAYEMAQGVRKLLGSRYAISVTGVAGPDGGTHEKPVGLVFGSVASDEGIKVYKMQFSGSRDQIRVRASKQLLWRLLQTVAFECGIDV